MAADHYQTLEIGRSATSQEIHDAYLRLVRNHHPDHNLSDPLAIDRFKQIQQAYEVLSNRAARMRYDRALRTEWKADRLRTDLGAPLARPLGSKDRTVRSKSLDAPREATRTTRGKLLASLVLACCAVGGIFWQVSRGPTRSPRPDAEASRNTLANSSLPTLDRSERLGDEEKSPRFSSLPSVATFPSPFDSAGASIEGRPSSSGLWNSALLPITPNFAQENGPTLLRPTTLEPWTKLDFGIGDRADAELDVPSQDSQVSFAEQLEGFIREQRNARDDERAGYDWMRREAAQAQNLSESPTPAIDAWEREQEQALALSNRAATALSQPSIPNQDPQSLPTNKLPELSPQRSWPQDSSRALSPALEAAAHAKPIERQPLPSLAKHDFVAPTIVPLPSFQSTAVGRTIAPRWTTDPLVSPTAHSSTGSFASSSPLTPHPPQDAPILSAPFALSSGLSRATNALPPVPPSTRGLGSQVDAEGPRFLSNLGTTSRSESAYKSRPYKTRTDFQNVDRRVYPSHAPEGSFTTPFGMRQRERDVPISREEAWDEYEHFFDAP